MHRKVDSRVDLLDTLAAWHSRPMSGWQRPRGHEIGSEAEGPESLQETHDEETSLVQRKFLSQTLWTKRVRQKSTVGVTGVTHDARAAVEWRVHERRPRNLVEQGWLEPPFWTESFGIGSPYVCSFMCEEGGHHYLRLGREVEISRAQARARARNDKWVFARSARDERGRRE
jgi:hypothetical protein